MFSPDNNNTHTLIYIYIYIHIYLYIFIYKLTQALVIQLYYIFKHQQTYSVYSNVLGPAELAQKTHKYTHPHIH